MSAMTKIYLKGDLKIKEDDDYPVSGTINEIEVDTDIEIDHKAYKQLSKILNKIIKDQTKEDKNDKED